MGDWYKLDNAAKLFPSVASTKNTSVFRVSAVLDSEADAVRLQQAASEALCRLPMLRVKLRKGLFWNYLDPNTREFIVEAETQYPCFHIKPKSGKGYLCKVLYYKNRVSVEVFHSLTDGNGAIEFLKTLIYCYLKLDGIEFDPEGKVMLADDPVCWYELEDSFSNYYNNKLQGNQVPVKAFRIEGTQFENLGNNVLHGVVSASALNRAAKQKGGTITSYLAALMIYSIYQTRMRCGQFCDPIVISIPVNLRNSMPSKTLKNFFGVAKITAYAKDCESFDGLVELATRQIKEKTQKENLQKNMSGNLRLEKHKVLKFLPLFLKHFFINVNFNAVEDGRRTITLSNLGNIAVPSGMVPFVRQFEALLYPSKLNPMNCAVVSVNDRLDITFIRTIRQSDILQFFFSFLAKEAGLDVEIYSNDWGAEQ